jgi:hypothetical protein
MFFASQMVDCKKMKAMSLKLLLHIRIIIQRDARGAVVEERKALTAPGLLLTLGRLVLSR